MKIALKKNKTNSSNKSNKKRNKRNGFKIAFLIIILAMLGVLGVFSGIMIGVISTTTLITADQLKFNNLTTSFYDINGNEVAKVYGSENRSVVSIDNMNKYIAQAFVDIEDERFYTHKGVDLKRTASAGVNYVLNKIGLRKSSTFGGSTITQQLVKNVTKDDETAVIRKLREQWRAINLERQLTKEEILEAYLNTIYLGEGCYGVQAASRVYFDKDVKELDLAESALVAGITQNPGTYDPFINYEASKNKQETVLKKMYELGHISNEEYLAAVDENLIFKTGDETSESGGLSDSQNQSYFIDAVCNDVLEDLVEKNGVSYVIAQKMLYNDGLKIYTTLDTEIQNAVDSVYNDPNIVFSTYPADKTDLQSAIAIVDYSKGYVVAMAGGVGEKTGALGFNRATSAKRQPGSSIKPIAVYGPALEEGLITPSTIVVDEPITIGGWSPGNSSGTFAGPITIRYAIQSSNNVVAVKVLQELGLDKSYSYLERFGITTLESADRAYAALALGGLTQGVTPLEMAGAFGTIANNGYYIKTSTYTKVVDSSGKVILENNSARKKVLSEKNAYVLTDMLINVVTSGTGGSASLGQMPVAGKTGTTTRNVDRWFVGYTPYYSAAVWIGYENDNNVTKTLSNGANYAAQIFKMVMSKVHANLSAKAFPKPDGVSRVSYCIDSGKIATNLCALDLRGTRVKTDWSDTDDIIYETCDIHKEVKVCTESGLLATNACPSTYTKVVADDPSAVGTVAECPSGYCNIHFD